MQVLELYSGIGGMHMALNGSGIPGEVKAAIEINPIANTIYKHNFPDTQLLNLNIEGLSAKVINNLNVDTILMSPPCQPFSRNGKQYDILDTRTDSFQHILTLLPELSQIKNVLIENVKGFETSRMREILLQSLKNNSFTFQEFILSPSQFGIPNSRHRYYCIAKKLPDRFQWQIQDRVMENLPGNKHEKDCFAIENILEENTNPEEFNLPDKILKKRLGVLDICYKDSRRSCCFTKAYGRFIEGTGSVYSEQNQIVVSEKLAKLRTMNNESDEYSELAQELHLRFFTPKEISRLMCFPETFSFPTDITVKQRYRVLGNSINVKVVSEIIKLLR